MLTDGCWLDGIAKLPSELANCFASPLASATSTAVLQSSNCTSENISRAALPRTITSLRNPSIRGRAKLTENGVTRRTQYEESLGVKKGTGSR